MPKSKKAPNQGDKESRWRTACERLGTETPQCILGKATNPHCIHLHHIAGKDFDDEVVQLCLNHHAFASDEQKDHPPEIENCISPLEGLGHVLLGLGDLVAAAIADKPADPLVTFLTYLRWKLKELGLLLLEFAKARPSEDFGVVP